MTCMYSTEYKEWEWPGHGGELADALVGDLCVVRQVQL